MAGLLDVYKRQYMSSLKADKKHQNRKAYPEILNLQFEKVQDMRYGENPHQSAAFYREKDIEPGTLASYRQLQGKELSYNNISDADAAWECVKNFDEPACVIIKHANPCGVAVGKDLLDAYQKALQTDPEAAFGGIIAFNGELDACTSEEVSKLFVEAVSYTHLDVYKRQVTNSGIQFLKSLVIGEFFHKPFQKHRIIGEPVQGHFIIDSLSLIHI